MVKITLFGTESSTYEFVKMKVKENAQKTGIDLDLTEVYDPSEFINNNLQCIPAMKIEDDILERGNKNLQDYIRELHMEIVKKEKTNKVRNIIVPHDFSEKSENAILYAYGLAEQLGSTITLLHVYHPSPDYTVGSDTLKITSEKEKQQQLDNYVSNLNKQWVGDIGSQPLVYADFRIGLAYDEILKKSKEEPESIFIIGTRSHSAIKKYLGSVSIDSGQALENTTLIVPPEAEFKKIYNIVHCVETSKLSNKVIEQLNKLCILLKADLQLLHISENKNNDVFHTDNILKCFDKDINVSFTELYGEDKITILNNFAKKHEDALLSLERGKKSFFQKLLHKSFTKQMSIRSENPFIILN
jgi:nucleotide-binding universal stress UspA family protein